MECRSDGRCCFLTCVYVCVGVWVCWKRQTGQTEQSFSSPYTRNQASLTSYTGYLWNDWGVQARVCTETKTKTQNSTKSDSANTCVVFAPALQRWRLFHNRSSENCIFVNPPTCVVSLSPLPHSYPAAVADLPVCGGVQGGQPAAHQFVQIFDRVDPWQEVGPATRKCKMEWLCLIV